ncbi:MAG: M28 family metallopeptidase [Planctomycetota bacterium]
MLAWSQCPASLPQRDRRDAAAQGLFLGILLAAAPQDRAPVEPALAGEDVQAALAQVSVDRLKADVTALVSCGTRHPLSTGGAPGHGVDAARAYLREQLAKCAASSAGRMQVRVDEFRHALGRGSDREATFVNLIAFIKGSDPARGAWVIGGHYDSRNSRANDGEGAAPGADDDASGVAVVLELARAFAGVAPKADVYLCAFDGEEHGLFGSHHLAQAMKDAGLGVEAMVTNDIVGASRGADGEAHDGSMRCFSEGFSGGAEDRFFRQVAAETEGPSRQLARFAALISARYQPDFDVQLNYRRDRFGRGGDHLAFNERGYAAIRFTEAAEDYRHQHQDVRVEGGVPHGDCIEHVDFDYLARVCRVNLAVAMNGALAPAPPQSVHLRGAVQPYTTVAWTEVTGGDVAGYRIWLRPTDASRWQRSLFVRSGNGSQRLDGVSIDDWQFAVSAVDAHGHESPARFPSPEPRSR